MKVLILGGSRYLGPRLACALTEAGHEVGVFNRGRIRAPVPVPVTEIRGDRASAADLRNALGSFRPDVVVDNIAFSKADADVALEVFAGVVQRYVAVSSVAVYGRPTTVPAAEDHPLFDGRPPVPGAAGAYAEGKVQMESAFLAAHRASALPVAIIRPSVIYGYGRLLSAWNYNTRHVTRIEASKPVIVPDRGEALIQPVYVDDVALAIARAVESDGAPGEAFNVCGPSPMPLHEYFAAHGRVLGKPVEMVEIPSAFLHAADPVTFARAFTNLAFNHACDVSKLRRVLRVEPRPLEEGLRATIGFLREHDLLEPTRDDDPDDRLIAAFRSLDETFMKEVGERLRRSARIEPARETVLPPWCPSSGLKGQV